MECGISISPTITPDNANLLVRSGSVECSLRDLAMASTIILSLKLGVEGADFEDPRYGEVRLPIEYVSKGE